MPATLTLTLFVARVGIADHTHNAIATHDLAVAADFLHRSSNFHRFLLLTGAFNDRDRLFHKS
jgi:hypothetical protein